MQGKRLEDGTPLWKHAEPYVMTNLTNSICWGGTTPNQLECFQRKKFVLCFSTCMRQKKHDRECLMAKKHIIAPLA